PGGLERACDPGLLTGRVPASRGDARLRARPRSHVARRPADGPAGRRAVGARSARFVIGQTTGLPAGRVRRVGQVEVLEDRVAVRGVRLRAELRDRELVLDLEHGLAGADERAVVAAALPVLLALLVDRVVEVRAQVG